MSTSLSGGTVFARRYRVLRHLAAGAMGSVYEVVHVETNRRRALKTMHPHLFRSEEMRERFKREARIAAEVESEFIVDVSDAGIDEATGMPFLVMELLRGEELGERLERGGRLSPAEVIAHLHQIALALDRTHAASIVHRDLKPENIFLAHREDGSTRVKILDFGVAKLLAEGSTAAAATSMLGTPLYMAPEQFRGMRLSGSADIYALGMMAYTMLVGTSYWDLEASAAVDVIAFAVVAARGPVEAATHRARACGVELPPAFDAWFARVTAVNPDARFRTAMDAVRGLAVALGDPVGAVATPSQIPPSCTSAIPALTIPVLNSALTIPALTADAAASSGRVSQLDAPLFSTASSGRVSQLDAPPFSTASSGRVSQLDAARLTSPSTGAGVSTTAVPSPRSRRPIWTVAAAVGLGALGAGGWLAQRAGDGNEPSALAGQEAAASRGAAPAPQRAEPSPAVTNRVDVSPVAPASAGVPPSASAPRSASTRIAPSAKPAAPAKAVSPRPARPSPVGVVKQTPIFGQD